MKAYISVYPSEANQSDMYYVMVDNNLGKSRCISAYLSRKDAEIKTYNYNTGYKFVSKEIKEEKQVKNSLRRSKDNTVNYIG